jgi:hypothetical protein
MYKKNKSVTRIGNFHFAILYAYLYPVQNHRIVAFSAELAYRIQISLLRIGAQDTRE